MTKHKFYALYLRADGMASWTGPYDTIKAVKASVPGNATSVMIATPLTAMTPAEAREARQILEGSSRDRTA